MTFDSKQYRGALGFFPTGITVITTLDSAGAPVGFTANSFNSVSLEPPLVLWSLAKTAGVMEVFERAERFAVHVLSAEQVEISNTFATPSDDRFAKVDWALSERNLPIIHNCAALFECEREHLYQGGDHLIFVARVMAFSTQTDAKSLAYHHGEYSTCAPLG